MKLLIVDGYGIIELRCFEDKNWKDVAIKMRYSSPCYRLFDSGIERMRNA
jgi:hypothetical protein